MADLDAIILFHRLQKSEIGPIVEIQFARLRRNELQGIVQLAEMLVARDA